jgi:NAD+ diphosphatase
VFPIIPSTPNPYTGSPLNRAAERRTDAAWLSARLAAPDSLFVAVWRARSLLRRDESGEPTGVLLPAGQAAPWLDGSYPWAFLGLLEERAVFALDLSANADPSKELPPSTEFTDLRSVAGMLAPDIGAILAHARGLMHWRGRHLFCGVCGGTCEPESAGNVMACTSCKTHHFPRTDPAVIMLVTRGDRALLGHSQRFPRTTMYSTLAGFVEPGESLEEAVAREVFEEAGVRVGRVHYHSSQPWPFPASIMLGFYAEGLTEEITVDLSELRDARWFSADELRDPDRHGFHLPRGDSIASRLIQDWLDKV